LLIPGHQIRECILSQLENSAGFDGASLRRVGGGRTRLRVERFG
jgi:hypothetical protein